MSVNPCLNARCPLHSPPSSHLRCMSTVSNCVVRKPVQKGFVCYGCLFQYNLVLICFSSSYQPTFLGSATSVKEDVRYGFRCTSLDFVNKTQNVEPTRIKIHFAEPICVTCISTNLSWEQEIARQEIVTQQLVRLSYYF